MKIKIPSSSEIADYQSWEKAAAHKLSQSRYTDYTPVLPVFCVRVEDVPVLAGCYRLSTDQLGSIKITGSKSGDTTGNWQIVLPAAYDQKTVVTILEAINNSSNIEQIIHALADNNITGEYVIALLDLLVGSVILLPETIGHLDELIAFSEIVRIPARNTYSISREYWENQGSVRQYIREYSGDFDNLNEFKAYLSDLHVIATLGLNRKNYYGGGGSIATTPGCYRKCPIETTVSSGMVEFIHSQIAALGFNYPTRLDKTLKSKQGMVVGYNVKSGQLHHHHYEDEMGFDCKLDELRTSLQDVIDHKKAGKFDAMVESLAYFHWMFTHIHPFANINNSIAMNIVNYCLRSAGLGYIPHLFLDYFAQRTGRILYEKVFMNAIKRYSVNSDHGKEEVMSATKQLHQAYQRTLSAKGQ